MVRIEVVIKQEGNQLTNNAGGDGVFTQTWSVPFAFLVSLQTLTPPGKPSELKLARCYQYLESCGGVMLKLGKH